jgi:hypothetical protein
VRMDLKKRWIKLILIKKRRLFWFFRQSLKSYGAEFQRESASVSAKYK